MNEPHGKRFPHGARWLLYGAQGLRRVLSVSISNRQAGSQKFFSVPRGEAGHFPGLSPVAADGGLVSAPARRAHLCPALTGMIYCQTDVQGFHRMGQRGRILSGEIIFFIICLSG